MKISEWSHIVLFIAWALSAWHVHLLKKELKEQEEVLDFYRKVVNAYYYKYGRYKGMPKVRVEDDDIRRTSADRGQMLWQLLLRGIRYEVLSV